MKHIVIAAAAALVLTAPVLVAQQQPTPLPDAPKAPSSSPSSIPDAPKLQLSGVGPIAPGKSTTPLSNGESGSAPSPTTDDDTFQKPVGATLPPSEKVPDEAPQQEAPATPANSQEFLNDPSRYTLVNTVNAVEVPFTVKDRKGGLVPGLTWRDVHVYENNVRQHITVFTVDPHPLSIAVVIDQSVTFDVMNRVNAALGALQGAFTPYDEVALFTYNNGPHMQTEFTGGQSARLTMAIEHAKAIGREPVFSDTSGPMSGGIHLNGGAEDHENPLASGGPGSPQGLSQQIIPRDPHTLNDAILEAAKATVKAERGRRRIVYVISDGKEYGSKAKQKDVIKYLQQNKVEVVATLIGDASVTGAGFIDTLHLPLMMRDNVLPVYTKATGGEFYTDFRAKGIATSFAKITEDARTQYTVWYNSKEPLIDGKFRKIEVRVLKGNLQVIAKDGYYPAAVEARPMVPAKPISQNTPPAQPTAAPQ